MEEKDEQLKDVLKYYTYDLTGDFYRFSQINPDDIRIKTVSDNMSLLSYNDDYIHVSIVASDEKITGSVRVKERVTETYKGIVYIYDIYNGIYDLNNNNGEVQIHKEEYREFSYNKKNADLIVDHIKTDECNQTRYIEKENPSLLEDYMRMNKIYNIKNKVNKKIKK